MAIPRGIQNGLNTHHQDQAITPHSFKMINVISNKVGNPAEIEFEFVAIIFIV